jgi:hypothetical protein
MPYTLRTPVQASNLDAVEVDTAPGTIPATGSGNGISFVNNGRIVAVVTNTGGAPITVTEVISKTLAGVTPTAPTKSVAATTGVSVLGPYPPSQYNDASGLMKLDFSATTGKCVLVEVPQVA